MVVPEEGYFRHFSFEIGSIFEEIAFMGLIEFIPNFISTLGHLKIFLFCDLMLLFG
jgi:hypothetical protein